LNVFRKHLSGKIDWTILVTIPMIGGIVLTMVLMLFAHQSLFFFSNLSLQSWGIGVIFGISLILVTYFALIGFENFDLNIGTIVLSSELIAAPFFALLIFNEYPSMYELS